MIFGATISIHYGPVKYLDISISQKMTDRKSKARAAARSGWGVSMSCGAEGEGSLSLDHVKDIRMDLKLQKHSQCKLSFQFRDDGL